jgi:predicted dehydrogenase
MIRLGVVDFDTSHVVEFTRRLNHKSDDKEQWVDGAEVVLGCPGESKLGPDRIPGFKKEMEKLGVELVEKPGDLIGKVDGVLVESLEGGAHWERAKLYLDAGLPCYVDKPFACSTADAKKMVELADKKKLPIFSASSLRYAPELADFLKDDKHGKILGAEAYGPAPLSDSDTLNPGLFHYGIHAVEILYTLMEPGCQRVTCTHEKDVDLVTGQWDDGRVGTVRGIRAGKADYGCVVFAEKGVYPLALSTKFIYRELLKQIVGMFTSNKPPLDPATTVEIVAFIEAALKSGMNHGAGEKVMA